MGGGKAGKRVPRADQRKRGRSRSEQEAVPHPGVDVQAFIITD